jgi:WD40 repeat protein
MKPFLWLIVLPVVVLIAAAAHRPIAAPAPPGAADEALLDCWQDLQSPDAAKAYRALWQMADQPTAAVKFLDKHLEPARPLDQDKLDQWLADLASPKFPVRDKAFKELEKLGELAEPALTEALADKPDLETRRRLELLLDGLHHSAARPEKLRQIRAVELLEALGTRPARDLLARLATAHPAHRMTCEAREALERLQHRPDFNGWPAVVGQNPADGDGRLLPQGSRARLGTTRFRHRTDRSNHALAFSPESKVLVSIDGAGYVYFWESQTGKINHRLDLGARCCAAAPRGNLLALGRPELDGHILLWDSAKHAEAGRLMLPPSVAAERLTFNADGSRLVSWDSDNHLHWWDVNGRKEIKSWKLAVRAWPVIVAPEGSRAFVMEQGKDGPNKSYLLDLINQEQVPLPLWQLRVLRDASFSADGKYLATTSTGETGLRLWEVATGRLWRVPAPPGRQSYGSCAFTPDGTMLAAGSREGIALWDLKTGKYLKDLPGSQDFRVGAISADSRWLAGESGATVRVWDLNTGLAVPDGDGHTSLVGRLAFSPRMDAIATADTNGRMRLWDPLSGKQKAALLTTGNRVRGLAFAPDGRLLASSDLSDAIRIWDVAAGKQLYQLPGHGDVGGRRVVQFTPNGNTLASWGDDFYLRRWQVNSGKALTEARTRPEGLNLPADDDEAGPRDRSAWDQILFAAGGAFMPGADQFVLLALDGSLQFFAADSGKRLRVLKTVVHDPVAFAVSPTGKRFAAADEEGRLIIGDLSSGKSLFNLSFDSTASEVGFTADGRTVVFGAAGKVRLVEVATGKVRLTTSGLAWASPCAVSPDGRLLVTAMPDTTALVWDLGVLARGPAGK